MSCECNSRRLTLDLQGYRPADCFAALSLDSTPAAAPKVQKAAVDGDTLAAKEAAALNARRELEGKAGVQLGLTVKKEQAVFGEWYSQVSHSLRKIRQRSPC